MNFFRWFFAALIIVLIAAVVYANSAVAGAIEFAASQALGTKVVVKNASLNPLTGNVTVSAIEVANPQGFANKNAVEMLGFSISLSISSLFSDVVKISEVRIEEPTILLEPKNGGNNLLALYNSGLQAGGSSDARGKKVEIDNFYITGANVRLVAPQFQNAVSILAVPIDDVHLQNIGKAGGSVSIGQVTKMLIAEVGSRAMKIETFKFGAGALSGAGGQVGVDAEQLIKGREAEVDAIRGLINGR